MIWQGLWSADTFILAFAALLAHLVLAGVPGVNAVVGAPLVLFRRVARWCEFRLNRAHRGAKSRSARGVLVAAVFGIGGAGLGLLALWSVRRFSGGPVDVRLLEAVCLLLMLDVRGGWDGARAAARAEAANDHEAAKAAMAGRHVGDTGGLDNHGLYRVAVESAVRPLCDGMASPVLWYLLFGLPGLFVSRSVSILAHETGRPGPRYAPFGDAAAALHRIFNTIPDVLTGLAVAVAALFVPGASPGRALAAMTRAAYSPAAMGSGWTLGAVAGALDLSLGGPRREAGVNVSLPWIGDGRARAEVSDAKRALYLAAVVMLIAAGALGLLALSAVA